jgi:Kdo2-lipid IVA lauroyltransferase/acyltransferase
MAEKKRKPAVEYLVYLAVRLTVCTLQALPAKVAFAFAGALAQLAYRIDKRHRKVAAENLGFAFPEKNPAEIDRLVRGCYRHFCTLLIEIARLPRTFHVGVWRKYGSLIGGDRILGALLSDRPVLIITAHFGNWELAGFALGLFGFKTYAIARVLDNPHLERYLKRFRQATGQTIIAKKDDFDRLNDVLKNGGKVATLGDQDAGPRGVFIDFLGRPASAHKAVALMAMEFDAVMIVIGVPRVGENMKYEIVCEDRIDPREYADRGDAVKAITQRYHDALARMVRKYPEQYFWLHRRWKTQPVVRKKKATA